MDIKDGAPVAWSMGGCLCGCLLSALVGSAAFAATGYVCWQLARALLRVEL